MAWVTIDNETMYEVLAAEELETVVKGNRDPGKMLSTSQGVITISNDSEGLLTSAPVTDLIDEAIKHVVNRIRMYINTSSKYVLGPSQTIPEGLIDTATPLITQRLYSRLGGTLVDSDGQREKMIERAEKELTLLREGKLALEEPLIPSDEKKSGPPVYVGGQPEVVL